MPIGCWPTRRSWRRSTRLSPSGIRRAAAAAGRAPRPRWCCVCWCSSTCATGVTACWNGRCGPIWCIATSPGWAPPRCPTPRPWAVGAWRWDRRWSNRSMNGSCRSRATIAKEIGDDVKRAADIRRQAVLEGLRQQLESRVPRVRQVMRQTKARVFAGDTHAEGKIVSLFEPTTEVIRKGKAGKPTEFGKMVKLQEAENQIVIAYEVYDQRPSDSDLLLAAIETHQATLGCTPRLVAADAGFYSAKNEAAAKAKGVKRVCIPNRSTKSPERKREQKKRWFRNGQKWRTGCEGRISVVKRRHGLGRSRYKGDAGIKRWVGLGVIADNLVNISRAMAKQSGR